ncbi:hypothetical protein Pint_17214 [Pistacia integerrima]|uniref:Uncharacterized protein n=1 Tax=Pistacia integerrima TaxID=434235 RepID=A0ACC0YWP5_9ROSI|nr:hypothetical protein Pint_17214 [Pistacia integerrima]
MMPDLGPFSDEKFDPKKWINSASQTRHSQDSFDNHLVDLEMKLQMVSEEIAASLEEQSAAALLRVPRATRDVVRLRDDAVSLRGSVSGILQKLKKAEGSSAESIAALAKVDTVRQRMEAAYETLQDAAGLTQLSSTVEEVFASGDLPRAAETLANMRHCLSAVGEVAEFANIRKQLEVLEDRLDAMVQPRLTDALSNRKIDIARDLRGILIRIGRFKSLELHYTKVHLKHIKQLWEDFESRQRAIGCQVSMTNCSLYLEQEWKWCMVAFPDDYRTLVPKLLIETMGTVGASFVSRINLATGDVIPETKALAKGILDILSGDMPKGIRLQTKHLEALIELHNMTGTFARNIQHLFSESDVRILIDTMKAVYIPYDIFKQRYGQMERAILSSEIAGVDLRGAVTRGVGAQGIELSETADELILALDDIMLQYISTLQELLKSLRAVCGVDNLGDGVTSKKEMGADKKEGTQNARKVDISNEEEWSIVQGALQILTVADCLTSSLDQNQSHVTSVDGNGELSTGGRAALDVAAVRLVDSKDPRFHALPLASQRVAAFADAVNELVYNVLISKLRAIATGDVNNDEAQFFATEWMFKVAEGATALYMEQLRGIQYITDHGAQQLSVDIEYLSNVLSALSVPIPPVLATFHTCLSTPRDQLKDILKSDSGNQLDLPTANLVCKIRRVNLD